MWCTLLLTYKTFVLHSRCCSSHLCSHSFEFIASVHKMLDPVVCVNEMLAL